MRLELFLENEFELPPAIVRDWIESGERKTYQKKDLLLYPFTPSRKIFFIERGLVKLFYDKDTRSVTHTFIAENQFIGRNDLILQDGKPRNIMYGIRAFEKDTVVYELPYSKIDMYARTSLEVSHLIRDILAHHLLHFSNRLSSLQFEDAQVRYEQLLEEQPEIILRAPLGDIASYLGISQQTLSVIRSRIQ